MLVSDATAALGAAARLGAGKRMKHISTQCFFIQKEVNEGRLKCRKVKGTDSPSDAGTKPLHETKMRRLLEMVALKFVKAGVVAALMDGAEGMKIS